MANIDLLLREAGSGLADIVKVVVYLTTSATANRSTG